jgi:single-strand DNA-binding protein
MVRMNRVLLAGRLTRDPVLRKTSTGAACADLSIAVPEGYNSKDGKTQESASFFDVVVWEKQAEACSEYLQKGAPVLVEGRLLFEQWKDKEGQPRNKVRVRADRVQFLGTPVAAAAKGERPARAPARNASRDEPFPE